MSSQNMAKGSTHGEHRERDSRKKTGLLTSGAFCSLQCSWTWFCASWFIRQVYSYWVVECSNTVKRSERCSWGTLILFLPCFHAFQNTIYSAWEAIVFKLFCPDKVLGKGCSVNIYALTDVYFHALLILFFWTQTTFPAWLPSLFCSWVKVHWNWKPIYSIRL